MSEVLKQLESLTDLLDATSEQHTKELDAFKQENGELRSRVEMLEAQGDRPKGAPQPETTEEKAYFEGFLPGGEKAVILPSDVKAQDALQPPKAEVSFGRWLGATVAGEQSNDVAAREVAGDAKQMVTTTTGVLIPQEYIAEWIDLLRAAMVLQQAGAQTAVMDAKVQNHSRVTADPAVSWHTEAGALSVGNPTFEAASLTAQTVVVRCQGSVELAQDSPDFGQQLANVMTRAMAAEIDRVGLHGSGTGAEPAGIYGATGVNTVTGVGAVTNYAEMIQGLRLLLDDNNSLEDVNGYAVMSPRVWEVYENLATGISGDETQLPRPRALRDTRFLVTANSSDATTSPETGVAFLGDFSQLLMGIRREASVRVLETTNYASNLLLDYVAFARVDFLLRRPTAFCTLAGITI